MFVSIVRVEISERIAWGTHVVLLRRKLRLDERKLVLLLLLGVGNKRVDGASEDFPEVLILDRGIVNLIEEALNSSMLLWVHAPSLASNRCDNDTVTLTLVVRYSVGEAELLHLVIDGDFLSIAVDSNLANDRVGDSIALAEVSRLLEAVEYTTGCQPSYS
jgi:hypothetical protein